MMRKAGSKFLRRPLLLQRRRQVKHGASRCLGEALAHLRRHFPRRILVRYWPSLRQETSHVQPAVVVVPVAVVSVADAVPRPLDGQRRLRRRRAVLRRLQRGSRRRLRLLQRGDGRRLPFGGRRSRRRRRRSLRRLGFQISWSSIHWSIHSSIHWSVCSFVHSVRPFVHSFVHSFRSFIPFVRPIISCVRARRKRCVYTSCKIRGAVCIPSDVGCEECTNEWTNGPMNGLIKRSNGPMNGLIHGPMDQSMNGPMNEWTNEWTPLRSPLNPKP